MAGDDEDWLPGDPGSNVEASPAETSVAPPALEEAIQHIPESTRRILDDLFRARFVAVKKLKRDDLKRGGT